MIITGLEQANADRQREIQELCSSLARAQRDLINHKKLRDFNESKTTTMGYGFIT